VGIGESISIAIIPKRSGPYREDRGAEMDATVYFDRATVTVEPSLEMLLQHRLGNRIRNLRVVYQGVGIVLKGRALTYHAKQLAQHAAMELSDLPILANDIEVR
jgi:hypothetical protein